MEEEILLPAPFDCPNTDPNKTMDLQGMLKQIKTNPRFARFVREELRQAFAGSQTARDCLTSYCVFADDELAALGYNSETEMAKARTCTEHGRLLAIAAEGFI